MGFKMSNNTLVSSLKLSCIHWKGRKVWSPALTNYRLFGKRRAFRLNIPEIESQNDTFELFLLVFLKHHSNEEGKLCIFATVSKSCCSNSLSLCVKSENQIPNDILQNAINLSIL